MEGYFKPGELKRKKGGQRQCEKCHRIYNNRAVPQRCHKPCDNFLGGNYVPKPIKTGAFLITAILASVRLNEKGTNVRVFANIGDEKKVSLF